MWTAFGIMLGYASGVVFHNVAGSGEHFRPTDRVTGELILEHDCPNGNLLSLRCVSSPLTDMLIDSWLTSKQRAGTGD